MPHISVREYEKIHVGEFDASRPSITVSQAEVLTTLKPIYGYEIFKYVNGKTISANNHVGAIQLGAHTIEVLPKIDCDLVNVRRNLVSMLAVVLELEISEGDITRVATQSHGILEILIRLFCDKLFVQVHRGLVRRYESKAGNLSVLRGKLGIVEQVRLNAANPERLFCRYDEFENDNPLNQVLKAALTLLLKASRELKNQRQLAELLLIFEGVTDCPRFALPWSRIAFDRLSDRYRPCFRLAELFLKGTPPDVTAGSSLGFSLFFDMNTLFEEYIGRMVARVFVPLGITVSLQGPQKFLAFDEKHCCPAFAMKPDVVGRVDSHVVWILDTKWKRLSDKEAKDGVAQSDLYQMYAYSSCYGSPNVVLLYPYNRETGPSAGIRSTYTLNPWICDTDEIRSRRVRVATISLENIATIPQQLKLIIPNTCSIPSINTASLAAQDAHSNN